MAFCVSSTGLLYFAMVFSRLFDMICNALRVFVHKTTLVSLKGNLDTFSPGKAKLRHRYFNIPSQIHKRRDCKVFFVLNSERGCVKATV